MRPSKPTKTLQDLAFAAFPARVTTSQPCEFGLLFLCIGNILDREVERGGGNCSLEFTLSHRRLGRGASIVVLPYKPSDHEISKKPPVKMLI